jgi:hypothetical protein
MAKKKSDIEKELAAVFENFAGLMQEQLDTLVETDLKKLTFSETLSLKKAGPHILAADINPWGLLFVCVISEFIKGVTSLGGPDLGAHPAATVLFTSIARAMSKTEVREDLLKSIQQVVYQQ